MVDSKDTYLEGMTLRDFFAGMAMQGYLAHYGDPELLADPANINEVAARAYVLADAMLERPKPKD